MWYDAALERGLLPDALIRAGIRRLLARRLRDEAARFDESALVERLRASPVALNTREANEQHYEVPAEFYRAVLGPRLKYSSCLWPDDDASLANAEERMLALTCDRAGIADGQDILELGCGWGSLCLYLAETFPGARVTAVSNSRTQKAFIDARAAQRGLSNVTVLTRDINEFEAGRTFDRVVSVEMLEHVRNYETLFRRVAAWMKPDARFFVHIFCHANLAYPFETDGDNDWMARHFFTGGLMPSENLFRRFDRDLRVAEQWRVNGRHYERTLNEWLARMDRARADLWPLFERTYGAGQARAWWARWRVFFMACAELFGYRGGDEWFVAHYVFTRR